MAVLLVLVQVFVLALFVAALGSMAIKNLRATSEKSWERQARFASYAGIQRALADLDADAETQLLSPEEFDLDEGGKLRYTLEIHNNVASADGSAVLSPDNTWIPPGAAWVRSRGYLGEVGSYQSSGLIALVARARPVFDHAIFAEDSIRLLNGSRVDSYSSTAGFSNSQSHPGSPQNAAHVASNTSAGGAIELASGTWVDGNVYSGLGSTPGTVIVGSSQGNKLQLDEEKDVFRFRTTLPASVVPFDIPWLNANASAWVFPWETDPEQASGSSDQPRQASYGNFRIRTNNPDWSRATNLFSGEYFVSQSLTFESDFVTFENPNPNNDPNLPDPRTRIDVHANDEFPVVIYVAGDVTLNNVRLNARGRNGNDPRPRRLQIYMLEENSTFRMTGSEAHLLVAGKGINVQIDGNSQLFGAVIGGRVTLDNAQIHYDTTLAGIHQNGRTAWDILAIKEASGAETTQLVGNPAQAPPQPPAISEVALDPVQGTRDGGNNAVIPQQDPDLNVFRDEIPRQEIEIGAPAPDCGTCGGAGVPGGDNCGEAGCPGHGPCGECNLRTPDCGQGTCTTCGGAGGGPGGLACGEPGCPGHGPCGECNEASPACGVCTTCGGTGPENCGTPGCKVLHFCGECGKAAAQACDNPGGPCGTCGGAGGGTGGPTCGEMGCPGHMPCGECGDSSPACDPPAGCPECHAVQGHNVGCSLEACGFGTVECVNGPGCQGHCVIP